MPTVIAQELITVPSNCSFYKGVLVNWTIPLVLDAHWPHS